MPVPVERERHGGMTEPAADLLRIPASGDQVGAIGVPEVVNAVIGQARAPDGPSKRWLTASECTDAPTGSGEYEVEASRYPAPITSRRCR